MLDVSDEEMVMEMNDFTSSMTIYSPENGLSIHQRVNIQRDDIMLNNASIGMISLRTMYLEERYHFEQCI